MNVGIIGAGLIGNKRAQALTQFKDDSTVAVCDINLAKARGLGKLVGCNYFTNPEKIFDNPEIDTVIVSTINKHLAPLSLQALQKGKHVLCEKPLGVNSEEIARCIKLSKKNNLVYKAGYNHRFHPAIFKAYKLVKQGKIGKLIFIKASYGHGARMGYDKEWRAQKELSGGGGLLDQGSHIIDLIIWFVNQKPTSIMASLKTNYWDIAPLEDNAFVILDFGKVTASFHTSWTQWKNEFVFEVYGEKGYVKIKGLGGSYGKETLIYAKGIPGQPTEQETAQFEGSDNSWIDEWKNFKDAIRNPEKLLSSGEEGLSVFEIIEGVYQGK